MEANYPYAIKNQRGASKIPLVGGILRSKAPSRGLWMLELVLYGIRLLGKQLLGTVLDIKVDQSALICQERLPQLDFQCSAPLLNSSRSLLQIYTGFALLMA